MTLKLLGGLSFFFLAFSSSGALACDDKPCEKAYIASTQQHVKNHGRRAKATKKDKAEHSTNYKRQQIAAVSERRAYARNRARRDFAVNTHIHRVASTKKQKQIKLKK